MSANLLPRPKMNMKERAWRYAKWSLDRHGDSRRAASAAFLHGFKMGKKEALERARRAKGGGE